MILTARRIPIAAQLPDMRVSPIDQPGDRRIFGRATEQQICPMGKPEAEFGPAEQQDPVGLTGDAGAEEDSLRPFGKGCLLPFPLRTEIMIDRHLAKRFLRPQVAVEPADKSGCDRRRRDGR